MYLAAPTPRASLADYLDLLEPRGFAGLEALPPPGTFYRPPAKYTTSRTVATSDPANAFRYVSRTTPSPPATDASRASCIEFCRNPANARECIPEAAGGSGMCSWAIPAATPPRPLAPPQPGPPALVDPNLPVPVTPSCPEGSVWNGAVCQASAAEKKSSAPMWIGLAVLALVARRFMG